MTPVALLSFVGIAACSGGAPAAGPAASPGACPRPGPLAPVIAELRDATRVNHVEGALSDLAKPRPAALALADALGCADRALRLGLLQLIERGGYSYSEALPAVARLLDDPDREVRAAALAALDRVGIAGDSPAGDGTRALLARFAHAARADQLPLLLVLGHIRPTLDAYSLFAQAVGDPDVAFRRAGADGIAAMVYARVAALPDSLLATLTAATRDGDEVVRARAIQSLGELHDPRAVAVLAAQLDRAVETYRPTDGSYILGDPAKVDERVPLVQAIAASGQLAHAQQGKLTAVLRSRATMDVRDAAAHALDQIGADAPATIEALADALTLPDEHLIERMRSDGREDLRRTATTALEHIATRNRAAVVRALLARLGRHELALQLACASHAPPELVAPAVVQALRRGEGLGLIDLCLGNQRALAAAALPSLLAAVRASDVARRQNAAIALGELGSPLGTTAIMTQLGRLRGAARYGDRSRDAIEAIHALVRIRPDPHRVREALAAWLADPEVGGAAAAGLIVTRADPELGIQRLAAALGSTAQRAQYTAAVALGAIITDERVAVLQAPLAALMTDRDSSVRDAATGAIAGLGPAAARFLPILRDQMRREPGGAWRAIAPALLKIGPAAAPALPEVVSIFERGEGSAHFEPVLAMILRATPGGADRLRAALADDSIVMRQSGERVIAQSLASP